MGVSPELLRRLRDPDPRIAVETAEALGARGDRQAVGSLVQALRSPHPALRCRASEALGAIGDPRAVPPLVSLLRDDDEAVRAEAFSALLTIGQSRAAELPLDAFLGEDLLHPSEQLTQLVWSTDLEAVSLLVQGLDDPDPEVRIGAAYTLGRMGVGAAIDRIAALLLDDPDADVRAAAAFSLGDLGERLHDPRIVAALNKAWGRQPQQTGDRRGDVEVAVLVMRALVDRPQPQSIHALLEGLGHSDDRVRQLAAMGLGRLGERATLPHLAAALSDASRGVRRCAAEALGRSGHRDAVAPLLDALTGNPDAEVRSSIGRALAHLDQGTVQAALLEALVSIDPDRRRGAAYVLGRLAGLEGLEEAAMDEDPEVRQAAALAMGSRGEPRFRATLEIALGDPSWRVRASAAEGLKRLGDPAAIAALRRRSDEHPVARSAIEAALRGLGGAS